jgi:3-isopropylmalate/(R)-2-methylmalate dehydratase small subunit
VLEAAIVDQLFKEAAAAEGYQLTVDLAAQTVTTPSGQSFGFQVDEFRKYCLLNGLDDIGLTLRHVDKIKAYETRRKAEAPWLFS